jgi:hypothetical protein
MQRRSMRVGWEGVEEEVVSVTSGVFIDGKVEKGVP